MRNWRASVAPRRLVIEACAVPEVNVPPSPRTVRRPPVTRADCDGCLRVGAKRIRACAGHLRPPGEERSSAARRKRRRRRSGGFGRRDRRAPVPAGFPSPNEPRARESRQFGELQAHVDDLVRLSGKVRDARWARLDSSSVEKWMAQAEPLRDWVYDELFGRLPKPTMPVNPRTRRVADADWLAGHQGLDAYEVVLDVYDDVIAGESCSCRTEFGRAKGGRWWSASTGWKGWLKTPSPGASQSDSDSITHSVRSSANAALLFTRLKIPIAEAMSFEPFSASRIG
jgi:hypothetical protein